MLIRPYQDKDEAPLIALWQEALADPAPHNEPLGALRRKLAARDNLLLIAEIDGELVGTAMGGYDGHRGWLYSVAVKASCRRRGVGGALVRALEARLAELGCPKVNLQVRSSNAAVVAFYEALGYQVEERLSMGKRLY